MKKTVFTICSVAAVCCAVIFSCSKDDNSITHVTYASQAGTGGNPDPNHTAGTTSGATTSTPTNTTPVNPTGSMSVNGTSESTTDNGAASGSNFILKGTASAGDIVKITFSGSSAPASGSYAIVASGPSTGNCTFTYFDASLNSYPASTGSVSVTAGSPNTCTFSGISCGTTYTLSGTLNY
ncbi:MAG: hypothetical protein JST67_11390 [Bacteroidetes bacterium]|nr:hypothetical protein [Bacteroidota bacterium]